jgi:NTP pyrophosphatase (non-canonical NTP hydrolase)
MVRGMMSWKNSALERYRPLPQRDAQLIMDPMQDDTQSTVAELKALVAHFVAERNWQQFHAPKNLSMSLAIEAAELMEHFQWVGVEESRQLKNDPHALAAAGEELADVLAYALALSNELGLDLTTILQDKMRKNELKYPAAEFRDRYK